MTKVYVELSNNIGSATRRQIDERFASHPFELVDDVASADLVVSVRWAKDPAPTVGSKYTIGKFESTNSRIGDGGRQDNRSQVHNTGDMKGAMITLGGSIDVGGNVVINNAMDNAKQQVNHAPLEPDHKTLLIQQLDELRAELAKVANREEAETVAELAEELISEASQARPKPSKLKITGEGLTKAAQNLAGVGAPVAVIAASIVREILRMGV